MTVKGISKAIHATDHYENFPVASIIIPKKLRKHVISVYNFARLADDIADEGDLETYERIRLLKLFDDVLNDQHEITSGNSHKSKIEREITSTANSAKQDLIKLNISHEWLLKLLVAFKYDSDFTPFETWQKIFDYCDNSANPIGKILLGIFGVDNTKKNERSQIDLIYLKSDAICTGLQIVNFAQDAAQDDHRGRPTFPKEIWPKHIKSFKKHQFSLLSSVEKEILVKKMIVQAHKKLLAGEDLPKLLTKTNSDYAFRLALEISLIIKCGFEICEKITKDPLAVWKDPPKLKLFDIPKLFFSALLNVILKK